MLSATIPTSLHPRRALLRSRLWATYGALNLSKLQSGITAYSKWYYRVFQHGSDVKVAIRAAAELWGITAKRGSGVTFKSFRQRSTQPSTEPREAFADLRPVTDADEAGAKIYAPQRWGVLKAANSENSRLFTVGGSPMRLVLEDRAPSLQEIKSEHLPFSFVADLPKEERSNAHLKE